VFSEYNVKFEHITGQKNIVADALSRNPLGEEPPKQHASTQIPQVNATIVKGKLRFDYKDDKEFGTTWEMLKAENALVHGNVRIGGRVCVPKKERDTVLKACHEGESHTGGNKLADRIAQNFYWKTLTQDCKRYAKACQECQANKADHNKPTGLLHPLPAPERPWEHVTMDFFFDLPTAEGGYNGVLLVVDRYSKMVKLIPLTKNVTAEKVAQLYLKYVYCNYGLPASIVSDQDTRFDSDFWTVLWRLTGTTLHMGAARHPQTDGQSERTIQTIKQTLRMYLNKAGTNWLKWLPMTEFWYNSATHSSTGKSPFEIVQGRNPRNPVDASLEVDWNTENAKAVELIDEILRAQATWTIIKPDIKWKGRNTTTTKEEREVKKAIEQSQQRFKYYYDKQRRPHAIRKGDWVRVKKSGFPKGFFSDDRKPTLNTKYSQPAKVLKVVRGSALLRANKTHASM
jgi:transposase InsO family protein